MRHHLHANISPCQKQQPLIPDSPRHTRKTMREIFLNQNRFHQMRPLFFISHQPIDCVYYNLHTYCVTLCRTVSSVQPIGFSNSHFSRWTVTEYCLSSLPRERTPKMSGPKNPKGEPDAASSPPEGRERGKAEKWKWNGKQSWIGI